MQPELFKTPEPECNSIKELFDKNNRSKYLPWFIFFALFLTIVFVLQFGGFLHLVINRTTYFDHWADILRTSGKNLNGTQIAAIVSRSYVQRVSFASISTILHLVILVYFIVETVRTNLKKDYSLFSRVLGHLITLLGFFITINLIFNFIFTFSGFASWDINGILSFAATLTFVFAFIFIYMMRVRRIIYKFAYETFLINQKNSSQTNDVFSQLNNIFNANSNTSNNNESSENVILGAATTSSTTNHEYRAKLQALERDQLINMANKLNIYGADEFSNEQLIDKIATIFEEKQKPATSGTLNQSTSEIMNPSENNPSKDDSENNN